MNECAQNLSNCKNMNELDTKIENSWEWINEFLTFISKLHPEYLQKYCIIPNMNSEFVKLTNKLKTSKNVPDNIIECLDKFGNPWKSNHIHKNIRNFDTAIDHNIDDAVSIIRSYLKNWTEKILIIISYIPNDDEDKDLIKKCKSIYDLCSKVWKDNIPEIKNENGFPKDFRDEVNNIIFRKLIENIKANKKLDNINNDGTSYTIFKKLIGNIKTNKKPDNVDHLIYTIDFIKQFLECAIQYYPSFRNDPIIPNKNGEFCNIDSLYEDMDIPILFKECMLECFKLNINNELIDDELKSFDKLLNGKKRYIFDYDLDKYFNNKDISREKKEKASEYLIKIIPKEIENQDDDWQNNQRKFFEIYKKFKNMDCEGCEIERNENNIKLWKESNKYIYKIIKNKIEEYKNVEDLARALNIDKSKVFDYLKVIYNFNNEGKIIPNQYEEFCNKDMLYNEGTLNIETHEVEPIPEILKDNAKEFDYDVRKYLVHPSIGRLPFIKKLYTKKDINSKIDELMEEKLGEIKDISKISDPSIKKAASATMENYFNNVINNPFDSDRMKIFGKVYLANVNNRLRELENPRDIDCKRWVWELIQNAKDSIAGQKDRNDGVSIEIIVKDDTYIFKHNGAPFTIGTLTALLYKFSEGKANDSESTGRFGTGFLTTHCLSKEVKISGEIITKENTKPEGFTVTMYREGEGDELLKGLQKTEKSFKSPIKSDGWTTYEYKAKTEKNKRAGQLGIENFKLNIVKTMLFCPDIHSIKLDDNGNIYTVERDENNNDNICERCQKLTFNIKDGDDSRRRVFLYKNINEENNKLSDKFNTKRNLRIDCAIELDNNNNIIVDPDAPCLFCSLPLVGSENHEIPFIINSPDFEPDSERQSLLLNGDESKLKNNKKVITDPGINKMILSKSQDTFKTLLNCLCKSNIGNRCLLIRGLNNTFDEIQNFDPVWYENHFSQPMRSILINSPIAWNEKQNQFVNLTEIKLPIINYENKEDLQKAYNLISEIYDHNVPSFNEMIYFEKHIWKNDEKINYITIKNIVEYLSNGNINNDYNNSDMDRLGTKVKNPWEWINEFLSFINNLHPEYLKEYKIIPNMNSMLVKLTDGLASSKNVPENMIECLEHLECQWRNEHIHKEIVKFNTATDHKIDDAVSKIRNCLFDNNEKILMVISYIPYDCENKDFIEKRKTIYELCSKVWNDKVSEIKDGNEFPEELWNGIDDIIFGELIQNIKVAKKIDENIYTLEFIKQFLECASKYYPSFRMYPIIPNKYGKFCTIEKLFKDMNINSIFKECMKKCFNYDINEELIHDQLTSSSEEFYNREKYMYDYDLEYYFNGKDTSNEKKKEASEYLIRIIPKISTNNQKQKWQNDQKMLFDIYKIFTKKDYEVCEIEVNNRYMDLWHYSNKYIFKIIKNIIEKNYANVENLAKDLNIEEDKVFEYLRTIIKFDNKGKIIPNQYGEFCYLKDLFNEGIQDIQTKKIEYISEEMKNNAKEIGYDIRKYLVHPNMGRPSIIKNILKKEIYNRIDEYYDKNSNLIFSSKFKAGLSNMLENHFENVTNPFENEKMNIFGKIYIANVQNRLRELETPRDIDCKRWVWELIQNAKDSIAGQTDRNNDVDIEIIINNDTYIFKHNGAPFTIGTLTALLYKFSEGKRNDCESTGRFGTGFLTTHCLSKNVKISGNIIKKDNSIQRFTVNMYREGEDDKLIEGLQKTEKSFKYLNKSDEWTTYEYTATTPRTREAGQLGIENFKENIAKVMLFCPEIRSIKLDNNGEILNIKRDDVNDLSYGCQKTIFNVRDGDKYYEKIFLYNRVNEENEKLSNRYNTKRNLRICCAIELDKDDNIIFDNLSSSLFCCLPLVGSENHVLPFIINSPDFEPDSERKAILLNGNEYKIKNDKQIISDPGINKMILLRAQEIYKNLLKYICENNINQRHLLIRGLNIPNNIEYFDYEWYNNNFINPIKIELINLPIIWNGEKYIKLIDTSLPKIDEFEDEQDKQKAYNFIAEIFKHKVPSFEETIYLENNIWDNDENLNFVTMKECTKTLSNYECMKALNNVIENTWQWINEFLLFINHYYRSYLKDYSVIPNMNSQFVYLTNDLAFSKDVPENMIECLESLGYNWKAKHIHKKITSEITDTNHNINDATSKIRECLLDDYTLKWSKKFLILIAYIPYHKDEIFINKRELIYKFCKTIWNDDMSEKKDGSSFPDNIWKGIDDIVFNEIIKEIEGNGQLDDTIYTIDFIKQFLECTLVYYPSYKDHSIIPNKNGKFCNINDLYEDMNIPNLFKECMMECFGLNINNELIADELKSLNLLSRYSKRYIYSYISKLERYFNDEYNISLEKKQRASKYLIRIIPKKFENQDNDRQNDQRKLFEIYKKFTNTDYESCEIERNVNNINLWTKPNEYIYKIIQKKIEEYENVEALANALNINKSEIFEYLRILFNISFEGKVIPNQYEEFCDKYSLNNEDTYEIISDELKNISKDLGYDVRKYLIHKNFNKQIYLSGMITLNDICIKIVNTIKTKFNELEYTPRYKNSIIELIKSYFVNNNERYFQRYFPFIFNNKENIIVNIIIGKKNIIKLLKNSNVIKMILEGKLTDNSPIINVLGRYSEDTINRIFRNP